MPRAIVTLIHTLLVAALLGAASAPAAERLPIGKTQIKAMNVEFTTAMDADWIPVARLPAEIDFATDAQATLRAPFPGSIAAVLAVEGQAIDAGAPLLAITSPAWSAALAEARARLARRDAAIRESRRAQSLLEAGVISAREAESSAAVAAELSAAVQGDRGALAIGGLTEDGNILLRAPAGGRLAQLAGLTGTAIEPGATLAVIARDGDRQAIGRAPPRLAPLLTPGMRAMVGAAVGELVSVAGRVDPSTRSVMVAARVPASAGMPGELVELSIARRADRDVRQVPAAAVIAVAGSDVVFVRRDGSIEMVAVEVIHRDARDAWIGGIGAGSEVAYRGVLALKAIAESLPQSGGD